MLSIARTRNIQKINTPLSGPFIALSFLQKKGSVRCDRKDAPDVATNFPNESGVIMLPILQWGKINPYHVTETNNLE